jgi:type II secretory pathway component GspD/PulD (secretin)
MMKIIKPYSVQFIIVTLLLGTASAWAQNKADEKPFALDTVIQPRTLTLDGAASSKPFTPDNAPKTSGYVAKNEGIQALFNALSSEIKKPIVLSKLAQKKTITGDFDISNPNKFLDKFSNQIGLAWYDDGQTIYVYDNSELKNSVVIMRYGSLASLNEFLHRTGLFSKRYPIRGEQKTGAFYVSGPPVYVDLVVNAAAYLDDLYKNVDLNKQKIRVIKLQHTFVGDRNYSVRDQNVTVSGIGKVIESILANTFHESVTIKEQPSAKAVVQEEMSLLQPKSTPTITPAAKQATSSNTQIMVIAYPDTNSLLVKGTHEQIDLIEQLIAQLDIPRRHIELSLWVIDIDKREIDKLGVDWEASINVGSKGTVTFNPPGTAPGTTSSVVNANTFLAAITALNATGITQIVTRPIILTQDNVPAVFQDQQTFYTRLEAERVADLADVTYGTVINVLPRYSTSGEEIEMILDIENGDQVGAPVDNTGGVNGPLPVISRTKISTVARVPKGKSLLIGGVTRDQYITANNKIPLLGDIPWIGGAFRFGTDTTNKRIRIYLIQPKLLDLGSIWNEQEFIAPAMLNPELPVDDAVRTLNRYPGVADGRN